MCGIVGVAGDLEYKDDRLMRHLLLLDYFRGPDSTGLAAIRDNGELHIAKVADHPFVLFDTQRFKTALSGYSSKVFIGHNRLATKGSINNANTHPFCVDHIVGVHNGTIDTWSQKDLEKELGETFSVDSHAVIAGIAKIGVKATIGMLEGAWSLVWYDMNEGTLNFLRNKDRPMCYSYTSDFKKVIFASIPEILNSAIDMAGGYTRYIHESEGKRFSSFATEENYHYRWNIDELKKGSSKMPKPKTVKIEGKPKKSYAYDPNAATEEDWNNFFPTRGGQSANGNGNSGGTVIKLPKTTTTGSATSGYASRSKNFVGAPSRPFANYIDEKTHSDYTQQGCAWCSKALPFEEVGQVVIERCESVIGPCCSNNSRVNRVYTKEDLYL
jgi:hypothetical protein